MRKTVKGMAVDIKGLNTEGKGCCKYNRNAHMRTEKNGGDFAIQ
jgi:hypothetical protein